MRARGIPTALKAIDRLPPNRSTRIRLRAFDAMDTATLLPDLPDMGSHLRSLLKQIPQGRVATRGALAEALGNPVAARWVGHYLLHHVHTPDCPCHRVVCGHGGLGPYLGGDPEAQAKRLTAEHVAVRRGRVDLARFGFDQFVSDRPLEHLARVQQALAQRVSVRGPRGLPQLVAGLDIAYPSNELGIGAYALVEYPSGRLVWSVIVQRRIAFPYITTYLTFRELPIYLELLEAARAEHRLADVLLVDGSGILHPRHAGIATHLGVLADMPTIGVTKKPLCGQGDWAGLAGREWCPVIYQGRLRGVAIRPNTSSRRPIFVSPGHKTSVAYARRVVMGMLRGRRAPEPLFWADRLARTGAKSPKAK